MCSLREEDERNHEHDMLGSGPEVTESASAWEKCKKNKGHVNFIPIHKLTLNHLPAAWQAEEIFDFVRCAAFLTVRLKVRGSSHARPKDDAYYGVKGGGIRVGTGFVYDITPSETACRCIECAENTTASQQSWAFHIQSDRHVVYDDDEASITVADLFYDYEECRSEGKIKSLTGVNATFVHSDTDCCNFQCITHDAQLVAEVRRKLGQWRSLREYMKFTRADKPIKAVIVSHPHGRSKYVTIGDVKTLSEPKYKMWHCSYNADTCPGSSGALILLLHNWSAKLVNNDGSGKYSYPFDRLHHCVGGKNGSWNVGFM